MTIDQLKLETEATLAVATAAIGEGIFTPIIRAFRDGAWKTVAVPGHVFSDGETKDRLWRGLRDIVERCQIEAIIIVSDVSVWTATNKAAAVGIPALEKLRNEHDIDWLAEHGYVQHQERFMALAQTVEVAGMISQLYRRRPDGIALIEETEPWSVKPQDELDGRTKMFGALPSPSVWHTQK